MEDINQRIAGRIKELRIAQELSLETLATKCGVSRSMLSLIERGESSPTAVVLEKIAKGLGVMLSELFDAPKTVANLPPVARRDEQPQWCDPSSGYLRRNVSPPMPEQPMRIIEVHFPPGAHVTFDNGGRTVPVYQQIWILEGIMQITTGNENFILNQGDCLAMQLDSLTMFHNLTAQLARYVVVTATEIRGGR